MTRFPPQEQADEDGLLAVGGSLAVDWLLDAYEHGIFPWPQEGLPILWFCPQSRGVIEFKNLHWPKSFLKFKRKSQFQVTYNQHFATVISHCQKQKRHGQKGTWITKDMLKAYIEFHKAGYAHSVEIHQDGELVGGVYGVFVKGVFSAESMFHHRDNASKLALYYLFERLEYLGLGWIDVQMLTPVTEQLGGIYEDQQSFIKRLISSQNSTLAHLDFNKQ